MKYLNKKPANVGSAFIESTQSSDTLGRLLDAHKKLKHDKIGSIFAPLTKDEEMTLAKLISSRNEKRKV